MERNPQNNNFHLLDNFPIMIYWMNRDHIYRGCNLETCRHFNEIIDPKYCLKQPILNKAEEVIGLITFQIPNTPFGEHTITGNNDPHHNANLQFIFEHAPIAFWMMDKNGVFIDGNPQAFRAAGVDSSEAFVGKSLADFTNMKNRSLEIIQKLDDINTQAIQNGIEANFVEYPMKTYDEPSFMHQAACALRPIFDNNRQVIGIAGVSFFNDESTRNVKFIVPECNRTNFMHQKS